MATDISKKGYLKSFARRMKFRKQQLKKKS